MEIRNPVGIEKIQKVMARAFLSGHMHHALLFAGPEGTGKEAEAFDIAKRLICDKEGFVFCGECPSCKKMSRMEHPDFDYLFPMPSTIKPEDLHQARLEKYRNLYYSPEFSAAASISIDRIRELKKKSGMTSFSGKNRIVIISSADKMGDAASNSILKLLEEPPENMYFVLTVNEAGLLLPTIRSRCQLIRFPFLNFNIIKEELKKISDISEEKAGVISVLCGGSFKKALEYLDEDIEEKQKAAVDLLKVSLEADEKDILSYSEELSGTRNISLVKENLNLALFIVQQSVTQKSGSYDKSLNDKFVKNGVCLLEKFSMKQLNGIAGELEKAVDLIDKNVYLYLIVLTLMYRVREYGK